MCLIAFAWQTHPRWRLVLAGNRDEFHARPSAALARWPDAKIIAGRDLQGGGTWLGVTAAGRCAAVTNVRNPSDPQQGLSRGLLVSDYLAASDPASTQAQGLHAVAADYRPFNLLLFDAEEGFHLGNRPQPELQAISPGVHGLSNATLDTPWPKTRRLIQCLQDWLATGHEDDFALLFEALADERMAPDDQLPDTGVGLPLERRLSAAFIRDETYGTRASTVVAIGHDGSGCLVERRFGPAGVFLGETAQAFKSG